jgi:hypothetical protein
MNDHKINRQIKAIIVIVLIAAGSSFVLGQTKDATKKSLAQQLELLQRAEVQGSSCREYEQTLRPLVFP